MKLVIGSKNYSSWSLRPWLLLRHFGLDFEEITVPLFTPGYVDELLKYSDAAKVPVLLDQGATIWDSLAICEYISETYLSGRGFPAAASPRALCRAYCSEMHGGFLTLRSELPMNCRSRRKILISPEAEIEIRRIESLWIQALDYSDGPYLFGDFSIADCMFAPVVMRFHCYGVDLDSAASGYMRTIIETPSVKDWVDAAKRDPQVLKSFEIGEAYSP